MHIVVRKVNGHRMVIDLDDLEELSMDELKQLIEMEWSDLSSDRMVLIFKGKILKDSDIVNDVGIKDGATLILTKKKAKKKVEAAKPTAPTLPAAPANPHLPPEMQQIMENPMMQQMMENMMSNPDMMEMMVASNPQMQEVMRQNPELRHALRDPDTIRQAMQMLRDPSAMQQALQNQDRAIANISNMPGGFNALSRMYNQVQAPMEDAMTMRDPEIATTITEVDTTTGPNSNAMPNPFAQSNNSRPANPSRPANNLNQPTQPFPNIFGNFGSQNNTTSTQPQANPFMNFGFPFGNLTQQTNTQTNNPTAFPTFPLFGAPQPRPQPQVDRFATQMAYLRNQGYTDDAENREALEECDGNLELTIAILLANRDE